MMRKVKWFMALALVIALILANLGPLKVQHLSIQLAAEHLFDLGPLHVTNTLLCSWIAVAILIVVGWVSSRRLVNTPAAKSWQNIIETGIEALYNYMQGLVGDKARAFFPVIATFFLYILTCNWLGFFPGVSSIGFWEEIEGQRVFIPLLRGATTDLNTTLALAVCSVLSSQIYGVRFQGLLAYGSRFVAIGKLAAFFQALAREKKVHLKLLFGSVLDMFIGILELFEELTKILSFSFRLFGNIFGGEVLLVVIAFLAPFVASVPFLALEMFGGFIQAAIFAILTTAFLGRATSGEHHEPSSDQAKVPTASQTGQAVISR